MAAVAQAPASGQARSSGVVLRLLQFGLFVVLLLPSLDEVQYFFTGKWFITDWNDYLAPIVSKTLGLDRDTIMLVVGVVQLLVAILIVVRPRVGGFAAFIGFWLIIANLLLHTAYDIVIRDFGLSLAALAVGVAARNVLHAAKGSGERTSSVSSPDSSCRDSLKPQVRKTIRSDATSCLRSSMRTRPMSL